MPIVNTNIHIQINVSDFIINPVMVGIIFHTRIPYTQENASYVLGFYVSSDVHFSHFEELKITFSPCSFSLHELSNKEFRVLRSQ